MATERVKEVNKKRQKVSTELVLWDNHVLNNNTDFVERISQRPETLLDPRATLGDPLTCMLCSTLRKSFMPVRCCTSWKMATSRVGVMAMERVSNTRVKRDQCKFRNPCQREGRNTLTDIQFSNKLLSKPNGSNGRNVLRAPDWVSTGA